MNLQIAIGQISSDPGCFEENFKKIQQTIAEARKSNANLVIFPELALCGYPHLDLVQRESFLQNNQTYLQRLIAETAGIAVICGYVEYDSLSNKKYNSAAVIHNQRLLASVQKQLLPDYDIFFERRYFEPGQSSHPININGTLVGVGICEDLWDRQYQKKIYQNLIKEGAELLVNISASPFEAKKLEQRISLVSELGQKDFVYVNLAGSYDGYDGEVVFDGRSFAMDRRGKLYGIASGFQEDFKVFNLSSNIRISQYQEEDVSEKYQALVYGIKEYFRRCRLKNAYIGLSGGIDSAVTAALAVAALGANRVIGVTMPSAITSDQTLTDAYRLAQNLEIRIDARPIKELYLAWLSNFEEQFKTSPDSLTRQNIQARLRGLILMEYANQDRSGLVISTGNKTELALGYCTIYGDMCGGLAAIADLNKMQVYELAAHINQIAQHDIIPISTIDRVPSAELELNQKDVDNLPADYDQLSPLVDILVDQHVEPQTLYSTYGQIVVDRVCHLIKINEFKRRQAAPGIRVSQKAFGAGRRVPIAHGSF